MTTNELPRAKAYDSGFWSRTILIKWPLSFVENSEQPYERLADKEILKKISAEAKGVPPHIVLGCMEYLKDGLKIPDKVRSGPGSSGQAGSIWARF